MLCSVKDLDGLELAARDGAIGHARDVYFDDERWVIRHVVVDTGGWLSGRQVLISPHSIERLDLVQRRLDVSLTRKQIEDAPGIETDRPVSRQQELSYYDYYGYPYYWGGAGLWGLAAYPLAGAAWAPQPGAAERGLPQEVAERAAAERESADPHLRSGAEVIGYHVAASDGEIGHIDDFLFDPRSWELRQAVVDTRNWLPGKHVLVAPRRIEGVDWAKRRVRVALTRAALESAPPYDPDALLSEEDQRRLQGD
jgi:uncharacterized protein YrrD